MERISGGPENQLNVPWWKGMLSGHTAKVIVVAKVPPSAGEHLSTGGKKTQALTRHSQAVQEILDYMQDAPDFFSDIDSKSILKTEYTDHLGMALTPMHCDILMQSGLVEMIILDIEAI